METETAPVTDAAPEAPWYSTAFAPDKPGELVPDWHTRAPEEERETWEAYKDAKNPWEIAAKAESRVTKAESRVKEAQTALRNKIAAANNLPPRPEGDAATPEAWKAYYEARNLPVDPAGYGLARPADFPETLWNDTEAAGYAKLFHELELTPDQVKALSAHTQGNARQALAAHQAAVQAQQEAIEHQKQTWIRDQKGFLVQDFGIEVDPALNKLQKLTGLPKECFTPDTPDQYLGRDTIRALASLVKMIPSTGDFTRQKMGGSPAGSDTRDRAYWAKLDPKSEDGKAWANSAHPRHKEVAAARAEAYRLDAELRDAK